MPNKHQQFFVAVATWMAVTQVLAGDFPGWQAMRVIEQEGFPNKLCASDLNGDGRDQLVVVNTRNSRLDFYQWLDAAQRKQPTPPDPDRPNDLPMAPDFKRDELQLEYLPQDLVIRDLDGDERPELIVLMSPPNKVVVYEQDGDANWQHRSSYDLLPGEIAPAHNALLIRRTPNRQFELLISFADGVQTLNLTLGTNPDWLRPREHRDRLNWWLADQDGDGDQDLVERSRDAKQSLRWFECTSGGQFMAAQVLFDRAIGAAVFVGRPNSPAHVLLLDGAAKGLLRHYVLERGEPGPLGRRRALANEDGVKAVWCGLRMDNDIVLVVADSDRPRVMTYFLNDDGWRSRADHAGFPVISDVRGLAAPQAAPGTLLLWAKDAADLQVSRWKNGRLTYPKPMVFSEDAEDKKILALHTTGSVTWWVQIVDRDLDLFRWPADESQPKLTRFKGVGKISKSVKNKKEKIAEKVLWLGGERLLVQDLRERNAKLVVNHEGKTIVSNPAHLEKAKFSEFRLIAVDDHVRPARLADGVLQWLGEDLHSVDQIMLPQDKKLAGYVSVSQKQGWAIQEDGKYIHHLELEPSGLSRVTQSIKLAGGVRLVRDPLLGLMLVDHHRLVRLDEGQGTKLKLVNSIDQRIGRPSGVKHATIHRIRSANILGEQHDDIVLFDDRRHQLTVLADEDGKFKPQISWPIFEDKKYPYGSDEAPLLPEPRAALGLDLDGDQHQDLAMICHDRLILYLAREVP